jgi:hypothetical protein
MSFMIRKTNYSAEQIRKRSGRRQQRAIKLLVV